MAYDKWIYALLKFHCKTLKQLEEFITLHDIESDTPAVFVRQSELANITDDDAQSILSVCNNDFFDGASNLVVNANNVGVDAAAVVDVGSGNIEQDETITLNSADVDRMLQSIETGTLGYPDEAVITDETTATSQQELAVRFQIHISKSQQ